MSEDFYQTVLQQQHETFTISNESATRSKERQAENANKNTTKIELNIRDPVYLRNHHLNTKLQSKWCPHFRIIEQKTPTTFVIKNQLDSKTQHVHARHLKPAKLYNWVIPKPDNLEGRLISK